LLAWDIAHHNTVAGACLDLCAVCDGLTRAEVDEICVVGLRISLCRVVATFLSSGFRRILDIIGVKCELIVVATIVIATIVIVGFIVVNIYLITQNLRL
jgi:hypothetical protein